MIKYLRNPDLYRTELLLILIGGLRMGSAKHLSELLRIKKESVIMAIHRLNKSGRVIENQRVKVNGTIQKLYFLGQKGCQMVSELTGQRINYHAYSKLQRRHHVGVNEVLLRLVQSLGLSKAKQHIDWWNTNQTKEILLTEWKKIDYWDKEEMRTIEMSMIIPDARLRLSVGGQKFASWIEFDTGTENELKVKEKFIQYIHTFNPFPQTDPIFWVCSLESSERAKKMTTWWEEVKTDHTESKLPVMKFFKEGEDTTAFLKLITHMIKTSA